MSGRALVAISGGVDSAMALALALESRENVRAGWVDTAGRGVPSRVSGLAGHFGVPLVRVDAASAFRRDVIEWSQKMRSGGLTPNPCARCNALVKLFSLYGSLKPSETLHTGHYARRENGRLKRGRDRTKDQSYFLCLVDSAILQRCRFPLGGMTKTEVRRRAVDLAIPFERSESMDLCYDTASGGRPGAVLDTDGRRVGVHEGIERFTIGQRKGLGAYGRRMYVVDIDPVAGNIVIGSREDLLCSACEVTGVNWLDRPKNFPVKMSVQTRYRRKPVIALVDESNSSLHIEFTEDEEAVAPGQVCALYDGPALLGGGIISSVGRIDGRVR